MTASINHIDHREGRLPTGPFFMENTHQRFFDAQTNVTMHYK